MKKFSVFFAALFLFFSISVTAKECRKGIPLQSFHKHALEHESRKEFLELNEENFRLRKQKEALEMEKVEIQEVNLKLKNKIEELIKQNQELREMLDK